MFCNLFWNNLHLIPSCDSALKVNKYYSREFTLLFGRVNRKKYNDVAVGIGHRFERRSFMFVFNL